MYFFLLTCYFFAGNGYGNTALHEACRGGNASTVRVLLQAGADVNAENHKGSTPLHIFCYESSGTLYQSSC